MDFFMPKIMPKSGTSKISASINKRTSRQPNLNFSGITRFAKVIKVSSNKYKIFSSKDQMSRNKIISSIKAFNDIEIEYSDNLDEELIVKSKKPIWKLKKSKSGAFILEKETK